MLQKNIPQLGFSCNVPALTDYQRSFTGIGFKQINILTDDLGKKSRFILNITQYARDPRSLPPGSGELTS